jgi:hypothetical protein
MKAETKQIPIIGEIVAGILEGFTNIQSAENGSVYQEYIFLASADRPS